MSIHELQEYTRISRYARYNEEKGRRETWIEQVNRVMDMHEERYVNYMDGIEEEMSIAYNALKKKLVLGSQRALQFGGPSIIRKNARMYNCTVSYADRPRFFQESMYLLLCGCGVGFSVQKHHVKKLPTLRLPDDDAETVTYQIPDSIEGWSDAVGVLMSSYFKNKQTMPEYYGKKIEFDYSLIRPEGALISDTNGKAPGPEPLKKAMNHIQDVIIRSSIEAGKNDGFRLRTVDVYGIEQFSCQMK